MTPFAERLRKRARELELSDAEVARRVGITERRYGHYVTGSREPNLQTLAAISTALATTPNHLLGFDGNNQVTDARSLLSMRVYAASSALEDRDLIIVAELVETIARHRRVKKATVRNRSADALSSSNSGKK